MTDFPQALRNNHQRILESIEVNLASEERQKNEALKNKRRLETELAELEQALDTAQHSLAELRTTNKKLQTTITDLNTRLEAGEAQVYDLNGQVSTREFESSQLRIEIDELKVLLANKNRLLESYESDVQRREECVAELNQAMSGLAERNACLEKVRHGH